MRVFPFTAYISATESRRAKLTSFLDSWPKYISLMIYYGQKGPGTEQEVAFISVTVLFPSITQYEQKSECSKTFKVLTSSLI